MGDYFETRHLVKYPNDVSNGIYICINNICSSIPNLKKPKNTDVVSLAAFAVDIDYAKDIKEDVTQPPNEGDMLDYVYEITDKYNLPKPSYITNSGWGTHCYWVFNEAVKANEENNKLWLDITKVLIFGFGGDVKAKDLSRVLRMPKSPNDKHYHKLKCRILEDNNISYNFNFLCEDFSNKISIKKDVTESSPKEGLKPSTGCYETNLVLLKEKLNVTQTDDTNSDTAKLSFCCIFHRDSNPSAFLRISKNTGQIFYYECSGCGVTLKGAKAHKDVEKELKVNLNIAEPNWGEIIQIFCKTENWLLKQGKIVIYDAGGNTFEKVSRELIYATITDALKLKGIDQIPNLNYIIGKVTMVLKELNLNFNRIKLIYETDNEKKYEIKDSKFYINQWYNFKIKKGTQAQIDKVLNIFNNLHSEEERKWLLQILAYKMRHPYFKGVMAVFYSRATGTGKSAVGKVCGLILGGCKELTEAQVNGKFNGWLLSGDLLITCGEYYFGKRNINNINDMITNTTVTIEYKGQDLIGGQNFSIFMFGSNDISYLSLTRSNDRISILESFKEKFRDTKKQIIDIERTLTESDIAAFRYYLTNEVYDKINFKAQYKKNIEELIDYNQDWWCIEAIDRIKDDILKKYFSFDLLELEEDSGVFFISNVYLSDLYKIIGEEIRKVGHRVSERLFKSVLFDYLDRAGSISKGSKWVDGSTKRGWLWHYSRV